MKIALTGATGQLGRFALEAFKARGLTDNVVAIARDPAKAPDLGVEVRQGDYKDPASLNEALTGIDTVVLISGSEFDDRPGQHRNVINAAKTNGAKRIVYTSVLKADTSPMWLAQDHKVTEKDLADSGLAVTVLRHGWYTENYTGAAGVALATGAVYGATQNALVTTAPRQDMGEALAIVASSEGHEGKTYEIAGDEAYTLSDLAAEIGKQAGKEITYVDLPPADYIEALKGAGLPEAISGAIADADSAAVNGFLFDDSKALSSILGRPTTSLADSVKAALAAL